MNNQELIRFRKKKIENQLRKIERRIENRLVMVYVVLMRMKNQRTKNEKESRSSARLEEESHKSLG